MKIALDTLIRDAMHQYGDFRDYDDANMIGSYKKMTTEQQLAVDNIFMYFCGMTFYQIISKYENQ